MCRSALICCLSLGLVALPGLARTDEPPLPAEVVPEPPPPTTPSGTTSPAAPPLAPSARDLAGTHPAAPGLDVQPTQPGTTGHTDIAYRRPRTSLLSAGLALFTAGYLADIGFTYGYKHQPAWTSLLPIAGPFIQLTQTYGLDGPPVDTGSSDADARANKTLADANSTLRALAITGAVFSGVAQVAGLALTIAGAATKRKVTRYARFLAPVTRF